MGVKKLDSNQIIAHRYWVSQRVLDHKNSDIPMFIHACHQFEFEKIIPYIKWLKAMRELRIALKRAFFRC